MARIAELSLVQQVRTFGWRVFDLADGFADDHASMASDLRQQAAGASRALARSASALDERIARRETERAFKCLSDAVASLDQAARVEAAVSVEASTLAAEATGLAERLFELCAVG